MDATTPARRQLSPHGIPEVEGGGEVKNRSISDAEIGGVNIKYQNKNKKRCFFWFNFGSGIIAPLTKWGEVYGGEDFPSFN